MQDERATLTSTHWGAYVVHTRAGRIVGVEPFERDPHPSPIGRSLVDAVDAPARVRRPAVRAGFLRERSASRERRGQEPFVEVSWDVALALVGEELARVVAERGNEGIFGGSYGWASAGRFHHAQSQVHRFLNTIGGYVHHVGTYSLAAARTLLPHVLAPMDRLMGEHTSWEVLAEHCRLFVAFGGIPSRNSQVNSGGASEHRVPDALRRMRARGTRFVNIGPLRSDLDDGTDATWWPIRPNTDTALMLGLAHTLLARGLHDREFLARWCAGFDRFEPYLAGRDDGQPKDAAWASAICGMPADAIVDLALAMAANRTMINVSWSLQRAAFGEQPFWMATVLAAMLGQVGLPGGGVGFGYGATGGIGAQASSFSGPTFPQGRNPVAQFIPVARITDMLLHPGEPFEYDGRRLVYPDVRLVYWAGGNVFHHQQDLNRLVAAWRRPETVVVHEQFWTAQAKHADIVLPATVMLERDDIGSAARDRFMIAMKQAIPPVGEARDDYAIFADLADRFGRREAFTEGRSVQAWLRHLYAAAIERAKGFGFELPAFEAFWDKGVIELPPPAKPIVMLEAFRADPEANPLPTPSGRIEVFSERIAGFGYDDCPGHPVWRVPGEWLGAPLAHRFPLHLISNQPHTRLHSQLDHGSVSRANKVQGREPLLIHPDDAAARGIVDGSIARVFNERGACLAGVHVTDAIRPGVVQLATGAWYDPEVPGEPGSLDKHGNPNVLTRDVGTSRLAQGSTAQTCLVEVERYDGVAPPVTAFDPPAGILIAGPRESG